MKVMIVEGCAPLARVWQSHLQNSGASVQTAFSQDEALLMLEQNEFDIIILNVEIEGGNALIISDIAQYRQPDARIIFVTNSSFFSDGSIFNLCANACAYVPCTTAPDDLTSMAHHFAKTG